MRTVAKIAFCLVVATVSLRAWGAPATPEAAVKAGREALDGSTDFPWYDAEKDTIRRIDVTTPADVATRKSRWQPAANTWTWPAWISDVLEVVGWILLGLAIVGVIYALTRATLGADWRTGSSAAADDPLHGDVDRIEALPFQLQHPQSDLLAEARRHYEAGNYAQAIIYLYSYQLVQLDRNQLIRLTKGKTNRQYLREIRPRPELFDLLSRSMIAFEDVFFGHYQLTRDRFESCWRSLDEFHQQLAQVAA